MNIKGNVLCDTNLRPHIKNYLEIMKLQVLTILLFFHANLIFTQTSLKEIDLGKGNHNVGFKHYKTYDSTRTYQRIYDWNHINIPRPIPVSIWYPSSEKPKNIESMTVLNYMEILKEEEEWEYLPNEQILNWFKYPNTPLNRKHLLEQTTAYLELETMKDKFPVVIYAPGYEASSIENFALCEYLASCGYIVISSPSRGTQTRFLDGQNERNLETQARDIEFLIKEVAKTSNADLRQIATMGFSFGGLSNVLTQMRNDNIKAIVSLDGSIRYQYSTIKKSSFFDLKKVDVPFIHMAQKDIPEQVLKEDNINAELNSKFEFYDSISKSTAYQLKFHKLTHSYFSTLGVLFEPRDKRQDKSDAEIMESYKLVCEYSLNFLNAFLKNDANALKFLEGNPSENGIAKELITQKSKKPHIRKFDFNDFNELASKQRYIKLNELYDAALNKYPSLDLPEWKLNYLGLQLIFNPETSDQAIYVFLLATRIYPNSANLFDSLAEAYLFIGDHKKAIENFEKSLSLNSQNQNAIDRLNQLRE